MPAPPPIVPMPLALLPELSYHFVLIHPETLDATVTSKSESLMAVIGVRCGEKKVATGLHNVNSVGPIGATLRVPPLV